MISIILPVYDEQESIAPFFNRLKSALKVMQFNDSYEVIAINDASRDNSLEELKKIERLTIINHEQNRGYGASIKDGIKKAKGDWIFICDVDGTYPIEDYSRFLVNMEEYDIIVGIRSKEHSVMRRTAKWILTRIANYISGNKIPDLNSGMRLFRKEIALKYWDLFPDGFSFTSTMSMIGMAGHKYRVKWIPIDYSARVGSSSIRPKHFKSFAQLLFTMCIHFNPLRIFFPICSVIFLVGVGKLIRDYILLNAFGLGGAMLVLTGIQIFLLGIVAHLISRK